MLYIQTLKIEKNENGEGESEIEWVSERVWDSESMCVCVCVCVCVRERERERESVLDSEGLCSGHGPIGQIHLKNLHGLEINFDLNFRNIKMKYEQKEQTQAEN